ncbi:MAG: hypothetical protein FD177_238 [Desulfovibrionaceae bacterium]|nr:MAG: hypothetical protein FD177_238 [Desulfovibrionaceae bacterium]
MNPRQFFAACLQVLGEEKLSKIWGVAQRQLYRYAADPMHCEDWAFNPIDRMNETVKELKIYGREDIAAHGIRCMASTIGWTLQKPQHGKRDVPHVEVFRAVTDFLEAHARGDGFMELSPLREKAVHALESLWINRRAECVSFSIRMDSEATAAKPKLRCWWRFGRRG